MEAEMQKGVQKEKQYSLVLRITSKDKGHTRGGHGPKAIIASVRQALQGYGQHRGPGVTVTNLTNGNGRGVYSGTVRTTIPRDDLAVALEREARKHSGIRNYELSGEEEEEL